MSRIPYSPPEYKGSSYNCPHCHAYAYQHWRTVFRKTKWDPPEFTEWDRLDLASCSHCRSEQVWLDGRLLDPAAWTVPGPNADMREDIQGDYGEAAEIVARSPRAAAALLRLAMEKLVQQLQPVGKGLDDRIGRLVKVGLPVHIQQALDVVRVIGNNSVHPGQIDLRDDPQTAQALFTLINAVADVMVTKPKQIAAMYEVLPDTVKEAIQKRDGSNDTGSREAPADRLGAEPDPRPAPRREV